MTRIAKHSSQKFNINTRNIHKGIFSCNLWWFTCVCNSAVEAYWLATGRVWYLQPWGGYFFPLPCSQWESIYRKNAVEAIFFNEIADSEWNAVAPIEVNGKKNILTPRAASTANTIMSRNIFWRQYLWKEYDLPQYKIFCLIECGKNDRMSWG